MNEDIITVNIDLREAALGGSEFAFRTHIVDKLIKAGIPLHTFSGDLKSGTMQWWDEVGGFVRTYAWKPTC